MAKIQCIKCGASKEIDEKRLILSYNYNCEMCSNNIKEQFNVYLDNGTMIQKGKNANEFPKESIIKKESKITKWEYKVVSLSNNDIEEYLNNLGNQGWELVYTNLNATILKRPKN